MQGIRVKTFLYVSGIGTYYVVYRTLIGILARTTYFSRLYPTVYDRRTRSRKSEKSSSVRGAGKGETFRQLSLVSAREWKRAVAFPLTRILVLGVRYMSDIPAIGEDPWRNRHFLERGYSKLVETYPLVEQLKKNVGI